MDHVGNNNINNENNINNDDSIVTPTLIPSLLTSTLTSEELYDMENPLPTPRHRLVTAISLDQQISNNNSNVGNNSIDSGTAGTNAAANATARSYSAKSIYELEMEMGLNGSGSNPNNTNSINSNNTGTNVDIDHSMDTLGLERNQPKILDGSGLDGGVDALVLEPDSASKNNNSNTTTNPNSNSNSNMDVENKALVTSMDNKILEASQWHKQRQTEFELQLYNIDNECESGLESALPPVPMDNSLSANDTGNQSEVDVEKVKQQQQQQQRILESLQSMMHSKNSKNSSSGNKSKGKVEGEQRPESDIEHMTDGTDGRGSGSNSENDGDGDGDGGCVMSNIERSNIVS